MERELLQLEREQRQEQEPMLEQVLVRPLELQQME